MSAGSTLSLNGGTLNANAGFNNAAGGTLNFFNGELVINGGTLNIESPSRYNQWARQVFDDIAMSYNYLKNLEF